MDLIGQLTSQLGVDQSAAKGLAGGLMGLVQNAVGGDVAKQIAAVIPEAASWTGQPAAPSAAENPLGALAGSAGGSGAAGLGAVLGAAGSMLGGQAGAAMQAAGGAAAISGLLSKFGIGTDKAALVAPMLFNFLQSKLSPDLLSKVTMALPFLSNLTGGQGGTAGQGGVLGALTGLLK